MNFVYWLGLALIGLSPLIGACVESEEELIEKRPQQGAPGGDGNPNPDIDPVISPDGNAVVDDTVLNFPGVVFQLATGSEIVSQEYFDNVLLVSMVAEGTVMIFGKDGRSWHYAKDQDQDQAPQQILPFLPITEGQQQLTMDQDDFWIVGSDRVSKRKTAAGLPANQAVLHNFDLTKLSGQLNQLRILGATHTSLILGMGTHIAVFSVIDGVTAAYEFQSALPGGTWGEILAAGDTTDGGYWLATDEKFAILKYVDLKWHWNTADIPFNISSFSSLAARIDVAGQSLSGDSVAIIGDEVWSVSGAPIVAPTP